MPNYYQWRVAPMFLADGTKPARRDALVFHLVDPAQPIVSTAHLEPTDPRVWAALLQLDLDQLCNATKNSPNLTQPLQLPPGVAALIVSYATPSSASSSAATTAAAAAAAKRERAAF